MWCTVVRCRHEGLRLKQADWPEPVAGVLRIAEHGFHDRPPGLEATLTDTRSESLPISAMQPLFDPVLMRTHGAGFLLRGWEVWCEDTSSGLIRHVSQIWLVVPKVRG